MSFTFEFEYALRKSLLKRNFISKSQWFLNSYNISTPNKIFMYYRYDLETIIENTLKQDLCIKIRKQQNLKVENFCAKWVLGEN